MKLKGLLYTIVLSVFLWPLTTTNSFQNPNPKSRGNSISLTESERDDIRKTLSAIAESGKLPSEWEGMSDKDVQREIFKVTLLDGQPPKDWESLPKFRKAKANPVEGRYYIEYVYSISNSNADRVAEDLANTYGGKVLRVFKGTYTRGVVMEIDEVRAENLSTHPSVRFVEQDYRPEGISPKRGRKTSKITTPNINEQNTLGAGNQADSYSSPAEPNAPSGSRITALYNLDRIDKRPSNSYDGIYSYNNLGSNGRPVDIYIMDTGVQSTNNQFLPGQVTLFRDAFPGTGDDCDGHGTSVASVAAGQNFGVAGSANIVSLKVQCASIASITQIATYLSDIQSRVNSMQPRSAVLNLSIFLITGSTLLDSRINDLIDNDVAVTVAQLEFINDDIEGSEGVPLNQFWPQKLSRVIRVGMTSNRDEKVGLTALPNGWFFQGVTRVKQYEGVSIFAPSGPKFESTGGVSENGVLVASRTGAATFEYGTSFAAPQVAGVAAQFLAVNNTYHAREFHVKDAILQMATQGVVTGINSPDANRLLYNLFPMPLSINSASYAEGGAPSSLVSAFASFPSSPTQVRIVPTTGSDVNCTVTAATSNQVNFTTPALSVGTYGVKYLNNSGSLIGYGAIRLNQINPGFFSADQDGNGLASGYLLTANKQNPSNQQLTLLSGNGNAWNPSTHDAYLILYGTGIRGHNGLGNIAFQIKRGSTILTAFVTYAGPVPGVEGQDQVNVGPLPAAVLGLANPSTHELKLYLNGPPGVGVLANIVEAKFN